MKKRISNPFTRSVVAGFLLVNILTGNFVVSENAFAEGTAPASDAPSSGGGAAGGTTLGICDTPEGARMCAANRGLEKEAAEIKQSVDAILQNAQAAESAGALVPALPKVMELEEAATSYQSSYGTCVSLQNAASTVCVEKTSPKLQETLNMINVVASGISGMAISDSCSTMAKVMQIGQMGLTAYTGICSAARASCESSCSGVATNLGKIKSLATPDLAACSVRPPLVVMSPAAQMACKVYLTTVKTELAIINKNVAQDINPQNHLSTAMKAKACTYAYTAMLASAGAGLLSMMKTLGQSSQCDKDSNGTGGMKMPQTLAEKCKDQKNANTPECLCFANPRLQGCVNTLEKLGQNAGAYLTTQSAQGTSMQDRNSLQDFDGTGSGFPRDPASAGHSDSSAGGAGAPLGGGGGAGLAGGSGGGSGGGGKNSSEETSGNSASGYNLSFGGGGGGNPWSKNFNDASSTAKSAYRAYLPGGDKDPLKFAGQQAWMKEVSGQGGKSNWEKVKDRYRDNTFSLIGQ